MVVVTIGVFFLLNTTTWERIINFLGHNVLATALQFRVWGGEEDRQGLTMGNLMVYGILIYLLFFHFARIPHLLREQRANDKLQAKKELLRRVQEYHRARLSAYEKNQKLQE